MFVLKMLFLIHWFILLSGFLRVKLLNLVLVAQWKRREEEEEKI